MTPKTLSNPRLAAKTAASQKAGVGGNTPTAIAALLNRVGSIERKTDRLLSRLDALGKIVANLEGSHTQLAEYAHQELVEIREALIESTSIELTGSLADIAKGLPIPLPDPVRRVREQNAWPVGEHGEEIDVDALAQEVHASKPHLRPNVFLMVDDTSARRTPGPIRRWLARHIFR